jgi:hypothetical protein
VSGAPPALRSSRLRTLIERSGAAAPAPSARDAEGATQEQCGLCGLPVPDRHRHVLDLRRHEVQCACQACSLLFDQAAAGGGHYRLIPERCVRLEQLELDDLGWRAFGIPVEMAFFVRDGESGDANAFYPSVAGATHAQVPVDSWAELEADNPALETLQPDVEGLLINGTGAERQAFIVGLDDCYRLVAVVRQHWEGFTGGETVWREIERFFAALESRAGAVA